MSTTPTSTPPLETPELDELESQIKARKQDADASVASQWQLMWWKFIRHKVALYSTLVVLLLYLIALFASFVAPYDPNLRTGHPFAAPQWPRFVTEEGFHWWPVVYGIKRELDTKTFEQTYVSDTSKAYRLQFFSRGTPYKLLGFIPSERHLFGAAENGVIYLMGTDRLGHDVFSRVIYGSRISLSVGLVGVALSLILGIIIGGISGYFGGVTDTIIQRLIEIIQSFPAIPLWMALAAAFPADWSNLSVYFGITIILSVIGWTSLARVVRGKFLSLRDEDFVMAARLSGANEARLIVKHLLPSFLSHIIATVTLAIPGMILAETALSFLGIGIRPPSISWGVLLQDAQNIHAVAVAPWLMLPGLAVVIAVLAFNFMGDGLRDAADPYMGVN